MAFLAKKGARVSAGGSGTRQAGPGAAAAGSGAGRPAGTGATAVADVRTPLPGRTPALVELCTELFSLAWSLRGARDPGDATEVRQKILRALEDLEREGGKAGYTSAQLEAARFALIALIDESVHQSRWSGREAWRARPLQRELFGTNTAGDEFYVRLDQLRANLAETRPAVEVCYACLILGFEGRKIIDGREKLEQYIQQLAADLSRGQPWRVENLAPAWHRPDDFPQVVGEGVPVWMTVLVIAGLVLVLILIFRWVALHDANNAASEIGRALLHAG